MIELAFDKLQQTVYVSDTTWDGTEPLAAFLHCQSLEWQC